MPRLLAGLLCAGPGVVPAARAIENSSPLGEKARHFLADLLDKHWLDGLYVSIVPSAPAGTRLPHTVNEPGNVIHAGVWTGRYLAGVGYRYAVTGDPEVRRHGQQVLQALRVLQEVTGKSGLLARGYVRGHGPVLDWERDGADSREWHQGQGAYADYRWYGDVSVDNFNAVLYGYAVYFDLAADQEQRRFIAHDVERLMAHLVSNHCRIVDVDGEVTQFGHVGLDPDPARDEYYQALYAARQRIYGTAEVARLPLRASLMLLADLLIAEHITGKPAYAELYRRVVARWKDNPEPARFSEPDSPQRRARVDHSSEGQAFEALYIVNCYERDPELLAIYRRWAAQLWEQNWAEGNSLFTYMTLAMLPEFRRPRSPGAAPASAGEAPHGQEALRLAHETLVRYPVDRVMRPVMNSRRDDIETSPVPGRGGQKEAASPLPIDQRPLDNEYEWKGNPYRLDGWLKPTVRSMAFACDDPLVAWFADSAGRAFGTLDGGKSWRELNRGMMGAGVEGLVASDRRTLVLWAKTAGGVLVSRDGGLSWRPAGNDSPQFVTPDFSAWLKIDQALWLRVSPEGVLERSIDQGQTSAPAMEGWRIPLAASVFRTPWGAVASGPGGAYRSGDGRQWDELPLWREQETGAADFLHAYWMGRYYGFLPPDPGAN